MTDHTCLHCGDTLVRVRSREGLDAFNKRQFCNREHYRAWQQGRQTEHGEPRLPYLRFLDRATWRVPT